MLVVLTNQENDHAGQRNSLPGRFEAQVGYVFPVGGMQGYLNLKAYGEFSGVDRPTGWNAWLTFAISPAAPAPTAPRRSMVTK